MDKEIYLHGISANEKGYYDALDTLRRLKRILKAKKLLCRRLQNQTYAYGFNGLDYISLCDYEKRHIAKRDTESYNAFQAYVENSLSFAFPKKELEVITPIILDEICIDSLTGYEKMSRLGRNEPERYSDYPDEVQVRHKIFLSKCCGLTFPTDAFNKYRGSLEKKSNMVMYEIELIYELLQRYGYNLDIFDIHTLEKLDNSSAVKRALIFK